MKYKIAVISSIKNPTNFNPTKMEKDEKNVKLVGFWVSPYVHRVRWALKLKGIDYEYIEEDIFNRTNLLSELNPVHGTVPVLVHHGKPVPESFLILEYIDDVWKNNPLFPEDSFERAETRFWSKFYEETFSENARIALCSEGEIQEKAVNAATEALEKIESKIKGKSFFGGETIGYLDLIVGFVAYMLPVIEEVASFKILDPLKFPGITVWSKNFLGHSIIKSEYMPPRDEMVSYFGWIREKFMPLVHEKLK